MSNRSNAKNIAREKGKRKTYIQKSCYIPLCTILPNNTPSMSMETLYREVRDKQQIDVVQWGDG